METLYKGQKLTIGKYEAKVDRSGGGYYLYGDGVCSDELFRQFGLDNIDLDSMFETDTSSSWNFPPTETLEELTKIYNYLKSFEENNYEIY